MKKVYDFLGNLLFLFHTIADPKSVIIDESIALKELWESPKSSLKTKLKIFYHDLRQPWPWDNITESYNESWRIDSEGKKAPVRDRALFRVFNNKTVPYAIGIVGLAVGAFAGDVLRKKWKRSQSPGGFLAVWIAFKAARVLDITMGEQLTEKEIHKATLRAILKHHPDKWLPGETKAQHPSVGKIKEAESELKDFIKLSTEKQRSELKTYVESWWRQQSQGKE